MEKMLLHACCGPCSIYPSKFLRSQGRNFTLYHFNPNIHPYQEFKRRLATLRDFAEAEGLPLSVDKSYDLEGFLQRALAEPVSRCHYCYRARLDRAAEYAKEEGYSAFSTTLLGSPYQDHEEIKKAGLEAAERHNVEFAYFDWRDGFSECTAVSTARGMYRQPYCGCIFSERDRYEKKRRQHA